MYKILLASLVGGFTLASIALASLNPLRSPHQTTWVQPGTPIMSDAAASKLVTHVREIRPGNVRFNDYYPSTRELDAFYYAQYGGEAEVQKNPLSIYVTGHPDLDHPSTDDLIQWAAHKWGIPEDWIRAQTWFESLWRMNSYGDLTEVPADWYWQYPPQARAAGSRVWESMGVSQIRWTPTGISLGTQYLRWRSTAFNLDYLGATIRFYYDGRCPWCGPGYRAGQKWNSIAAWFRDDPWNGPRQRWYIKRVKTVLQHRDWITRSTFGVVPH